MSVETRPAPKVSVARVAVDSDALERARGAGHAITARLVADVRDVTSTSFVAPLADVPSRNGTRYVPNHVVMMFYIVIQKVYSLLRSDLAVKIYFVTVYTRKYDDSIFFEVVLKLREFADPIPSIQIDTGRFEQVLNHGTYLVTLAIRFVFRIFVYSRYRYN
jgi:hypothetical protein